MTPATHNLQNSPRKISLNMNDLIAWKSPNPHERLSLLRGEGGGNNKSKKKVSSEQRAGAT